MHHSLEGHDTLEQRQGKEEGEGDHEDDSVHGCATPAVARIMTINCTNESY